MSGLGMWWVRDAPRLTRLGDYKCLDDENDRHRLALWTGERPVDPVLIDLALSRLFIPDVLTVDALAQLDVDSLTWDGMDADGFGLVRWFADYLPSFTELAKAPRLTPEQVDVLATVAAVAMRTAFTVRHPTEPEAGFLDRYYLQSAVNALVVKVAGRVRPDSPAARRLVDVHLTLQRNWNVSRTSTTAGSRHEAWRALLPLTTANELLAHLPFTALGAERMSRDAHHQQDLIDEVCYNWRPELGRDPLYEYETANLPLRDAVRRPGVPHMLAHSGTRVGALAAVLSDGLTASDLDMLASVYTFDPPVQAAVAAASACPARVTREALTPAAGWARQTLTLRRLAATRDQWDDETTRAVCHWLFVQVSSEQLEAWQTSGMLGDVLAVVSPEVLNGLTRSFGAQGQGAATLLLTAAAVA